MAYSRDSFNHSSFWSRRFPFLFLVLVAVLAVGWWGYSQYQQNQALNVELQTLRSINPHQTDAQVDELVAQVRKLIILPADEQPTVATVTEPAKLAGQPFFSQAKTGDKVLIYNTVKKVVLYRPSENAIVEVGPISPKTDLNTTANDSATTSPSK